MNGPISSWIVRMGNSSSQCWSLSVAEVFHLDKKPGTVMIKKKKSSVVILYVCKSLGPLVYGFLLFHLTFYKELWLNGDMPKARMPQPFQPVPGLWRHFGGQDVWECSQQLLNYHKLIRALWRRMPMLQQAPSKLRKLPRFGPGTFTGVITRAVMGTRARGLLLTPCS